MTHAGLALLHTREAAKGEFENNLLMETEEQLVIIDAIMSALRFMLNDPDIRNNLEDFVDEIFEEQKKRDKP